MHFNFLFSFLVNVFPHKMNSDQEIIRIGKQLEKIASSDAPNDEQALDLLKALQGYEMNLDVLQKSRVGMTVNKLRQKYSGTDLASVAKKLIKSWKKLLPSGQSSSTPKSTHRTNSSPPNPQAETTPTSSQQRTLNPPTPPPVTYTAHASPSSSSSTSNEANGSNDSSTKTDQVPNGAVGGQSPNGAGVLRRLSSTSDDIVLNFPASIDGSARCDSSGSDIRDKCRDLIVKAMKKCLTNVSIEEDIKLYNLCAKIEESIYSEFRDVGNKYKQRIRSRVANLGDVKNPSLKQNVISGQISPERIAVMTTDEMASDSMKSLRQKFVKEAIRDAQVSTSGGGTKTDLLKCSKCRKRNCTYTQAQTRSADEPMTTFVYCNECGYRWKFC